MSCIYGKALELIRNTPLISINRLNPHKRVNFLAKMECFNPGGSIKDRPALYVIEEAEKIDHINGRGTLRWTPHRQVGHFLYY